MRLPRRQFERALQARFRDELVDASVSALRRSAPQSSAHRLLSFPQAAAGAFLALTVAAFFAAAPLALLIALNAGATLYFIAAIGFRVYLTVITLRLPPKVDAPPPLPDARLPTVTILLPVHDEADSLASLRTAIDAIDYPRERLDIKMLIEQDDAGTLAEAKRLGLDEAFDLILIPRSAPQTKPKACNHALQLARGELIVIYDAEDAPAPDQLRKAAAAFAVADETLICMQAQLNYYNADESWLTRLFALEYALWFDSFLPALEALRMPIPLGGTSNIFRTEALKKLGGWDPYNVTEDADLGLRLAREGFRTAILDSTTLEEANCQTGNWVRQRSRWLKGYMQTWLVHMRDPAGLVRATGWRGFAAMQLFVAGNVFSALINPVLWAVFAFWLATRSASIASVFPEPLLSLNLAAFVLGNCFFIYLAVIAPLKRGWPELAPNALLAPAYWALTSIAAYRALWQLFTRPFFWEKTDHMLSPAAQLRREEALERLKAKGA
ncbi:MAG: glycosyltransferase [Amphiplicatus sp.]